MKVFVLFHADIEDDRYVRGVYATEEAAEADVEGWHIEWELPRRHYSSCCSVLIFEVRTEPHPLYGPFRSELIDPNAQSLFGYDLSARLMESFSAPSPLLEWVRQGNAAAIGRVSKIEEDDLGVRVEVQLEPGQVGDR